MKDQTMRRSVAARPSQTRNGRAPADASIDVALPAAPR